MLWPGHHLLEEAVCLSLSSLSASLSLSVYIPGEVNPEQWKPRDDPKKVMFLCIIKLEWHWCSKYNRYIKCLSCSAVIYMVLFSHSLLVLEPTCFSVK